MASGSSNGVAAPLTTLLAVHGHDTPDELEKTIRDAYALDDLLAMALDDPDVEIRKAAIYAYSMAGKASDAAPLAAALHTDLADVHEMVEQALWRMWFKSGRADVDALMQEGIHRLEAQRFDEARVLFDRVISLAPDYAEGYNQRAVVYYLQQAWTESIEDCRKVLSINAVHFGALAGLGHCCLQRREFQAALKAYEDALAVNPHMPAVRDNINRIRQWLDEA